jgi:aminopeptidase N
MPIPRQVKYTCAFVLLGVLSSCDVFLRTTAGRSARNPIELDTLDFVISSEADLPAQESATRLLDVIHTELDLQFNLADQCVIGKAGLQLTAFASPIDTLVLDARGFEIEHVGIERKSSLIEPKWTYDHARLRVVLDQPLTKRDTLQILVSYKAYPAKLEGGAGSAITSAQGLYFINPKGDSAHSPQQVWSQGETEFNSGWFPCVDHPNEKHTQGVLMTVDTSFTTLSNGKLVYSIDNGDGTKSDYWRQSLPHSTYLTMIAFGDFSVVKDEWRGLPVWYYVDPPFAPHAKQIFGNTPEMLEFYSERLGYPYPWEKFHQVVVHDFVSGAMENTSAVVHGEFVQQTPREMLDGTHEDVIAHELFHHWFGDLVTAESWVQITMNEGFATYGEYLWWEHKYGQDEASEHLKRDLDAYLNEVMRGKRWTLVRDVYENADDVFDGHSYQKGGRVIHMLRKELGDELFFEGLKKYVRDNAFGTVEDVHLRLAMEAVSGRDLRWFFDQWYHQKGHPMVQVTTALRDSGTVASIQFDQRAAPFGLFRFHVDVVAGNDHEQAHKRMWVDELLEGKEWNLPFQATWVSVDPWGDMLWEKKESKSEHMLMAQLDGAPTYRAAVDAIETLVKGGARTNSRFADLLHTRLLDDSLFWAEQVALVHAVVRVGSIDTQRVCKQLFRLGTEGQHSKVRAEALLALDTLSRNDTAYTTMIAQCLGDTSLLVIRTALSILADRDPCAADYVNAYMRKRDAKEMLAWIARLHAACGNPEQMRFFLEEGEDLEGFDRFIFNASFVSYADKAQNDEVYDALVKRLATVALDPGATWWEVRTAIQSLLIAESYYQKVIDEIGADPDASEVDVERLARIRNKKANLSALILELEGDEEE